MIFGNRTMTATMTNVDQELQNKCRVGEYYLGQQTPVSGDQHRAAYPRACRTAELSHLVMRSLWRSTTSGGPYRHGPVMETFLPQSMSPELPPNPARSPIQPTPETTPVNLRRPPPIRAPQPK